MPAATAAAFLIDVLAYPKDDMPRLVYADWLDEYGGERGRKHADFIRLQVRLARTQHDHRPGGASLGGRCPACALCKELWPLECWAQDHLVGAALCGRVTFRRGFVEEFWGPCRVWLEHGPALARAAPVAWVGLTDREPRNALRPDEWWWWEEDEAHLVPVARCNLPTALWELLPRNHLIALAPGWRGIRYDSRVAAVDALSVACLALARQPFDELVQSHSTERKNQDDNKHLPSY
jgi:uncharacterized protein (TIGR02996 family)